MSTWNANRVIVLAGALVSLAAIALFVVATGAPEQVVPFVPGVLAGLAIAFFAPAWMYLVAGLLLAAFPLVVIVVFGAYEAFLHPGAGLDANALTLLAVGALFGLVGGIAGFVQVRRKAAPGARETLRTPQGLVSALVLALAAGMMLSSTLAAADYRTLGALPASSVVADETIQMSTTGAAFAPQSLDVPVGKLVALRITNGDPFAHTFTYHAADGERNAIIPPNGETTLYFKFDAPQTIHFWCAPHSSGADDTMEGSMWGDMQVA